VHPKDLPPWSGTSAFDFNHEGGRNGKDALLPALQFPRLDSKVSTTAKSEGNPDSPVPVAFVASFQVDNHGFDDNGDVMCLPAFSTSRQLVGAYLTRFVPFFFELSKEQVCRLTCTAPFFFA